MSYRICRYCKRDINAIGQENVSTTISYACCEDCAGRY